MRISACNSVMRAALVLLVLVVLDDTHVSSVQANDDYHVQNIGSKSNFIQLLQSLIGQSSAFMPRMNPGANYAYMSQPSPMHIGPPQAAIRPNPSPPIYAPPFQPILTPPKSQVQMPKQQSQAIGGGVATGVGAAGVAGEYSGVSGGNPSSSSSSNLFNSDNCGVIRPMVTNYVSGGSPIDNLEHPWYVQIIIHNTDYTESETYCGGTLITAEWVLTAAHCYDDMRRDRMARSTHIIFRGIHGHHRKFKAYADLVILHKDYVPALLPWEAEAQGLRPGPFNDLALVRLRIADIPHSITSKLVPACLPALNVGVSPGTVCKVMGHGFMNSEDEKNFYMPPVLQAADVSISTNRECQDDVESRAIKEKINEKTCCVRGPIHPCVGDSGGPLLCTGKSRREIDGSAKDAQHLSDEYVLSENYKPRKWFLVGVTSFAVSTDNHDTCGTFKSAVFGLVSTHLEWIRNTVLKHSYNHGGGGHGHGHHGGHSYGGGHHGYNYYN